MLHELCSKLLDIKSILCYYQVNFLLWTLQKPRVQIFLLLLANINRVFGLGNQPILDKLAYHEPIPQIWWNNFIPHTRVR